MRRHAIKFLGVGLCLFFAPILFVWLLKFMGLSGYDILLGVIVCGAFVIVCEIISF